MQVDSKEKAIVIEVMFWKLAALRARRLKGNLAGKMLNLGYLRGIGLGCSSPVKSRLGGGSTKICM